MLSGRMPCFKNYCLSHLVLFSNSTARRYQRSLSVWRICKPMEWKHCPVGDLPSSCQATKSCRIDEGEFGALQHGDYISNNIGDEMLEGTNTE